MIQTHVCVLKGCHAPAIHMRGIANPLQFCHSKGGKCHDGASEHTTPCLQGELQARAMQLPGFCAVNAVPASRGKMVPGACHCVTTLMQPDKPCESVANLSNG